MSAYIYQHLNTIRSYVFKWVESGQVTEEKARPILQIASNLQKKQFDKQSAFLRISNLFIVLGAAMLLSSLLYFFASNWKGMTHLEKISVVVAAMLIPYVSAFIIKSLSQSYKNLCLFAGVFIFGIGVALIGQAYNSHADSYMLFLVWSVPTILLSILIRYEPFYVLGIILVNLAGWFYVNPYFIQMEWPSFLKMFLINLVLTSVFYLSEHLTITGKYSKYIAFTCSSFYLYLLTFYEIVKWNLLITNLIFIAMVLGAGIYHLRYKLDVPMVYTSAAVGIIYIISKFVEIIAYNFNEGGIYTNDLFGFGLIAINYYVFDKINLEIKKARHEQ